VYFGTGNGVPQYGGDHRAGENLYLASVVALEIKTGRLRWHYQTIHHDIWEADLAQPTVLFDTRIGGQLRKGIAAMRADGYLFLLDRVTGKPLMPIEERKVPQDKRGRTAATQPFPVGADRVLLDCDDWKKEPIPSGFMVGCFFTPASVEVPNLLTSSWGMRVVPMSFSPQTGYFYAVGNASLQWFRRTEDPYFFSLGFGAGKVPGLPPGRAFLAALDSKTNKIVWRNEYRGGRPGSPLTTAGGLLFQMMSDGKFTASDAKTGQVVWQFQASTTGGGGPAASYEIDGEQYIAVALRDKLWAFKLGGSLPQVPAAPAAAPPAALQGFTGPVQDLTNDPSRPVERFTNAIHVASLARDNPATGEHFTTDEYAFSVYRARVRAGTSVRWLNNGSMVHTVTAEDGSWSTPPLNPIQVGVVKFDKPGTYNYMCKEHPWAKAQLIVVP
jgi:alcohol dehydrogenase (cytochrome c)